MSSAGWQADLLRWYQRNKRDLPWRHTKDPYKIWVSEIMLQQTTVETVIPYYERFLKKFPTVDSLAKAPEEEVLAAWAGLGYYSRARNLWKAARVGGSLPKTAEEWIKLPGVGRYTAGAIASIAFGERAPILDGNVIRVLARIFALKQNPKSSQGQKIFWKKAEEILPKKNCGDFNQALMELGAMVCSPEKPLCLLCPLIKHCEARRQGKIGLYPKRKRKVIYRKVELEVALVQQDGKLLMRRRSKKGFLKGMWEFPTFEKKSMRIEKTLHPVRHSIMNQRLKITPYLCRLKSPRVPSGGFRWLAPVEINQMATSSMNRKILLRFSSLP